MRGLKSHLAQRCAKAGRAGRTERGAAAVEFAMVATPFFFLLFALFEVMISFFIQTSLESAVAEESRKIKTGQASAGSGTNAATFKANICARMVGMINCDDRLFVMVQRQPTVGALPSPFSDPTLLAAPPYEADTPAGAIVVVRAFYMYKLITPGVTGAMSNTTSQGPNGNLGSGNRLLVATSAFRNEPFQ
jgi:hypothetical protein